MPSAIESSPEVSDESVELDVDQPAVSEPAGELLGHPDLKLTSAVSTVPAVRPGASWYFQ